MNILQLESFVKIAQLKSFSEAAFELDITPSSLTKYIQKLEQELNIQLFHRSKHSITLTPAGTDFYLFATHTLKEYAATLNKLQQYQQNKQLNLGCIENLGKLGIAEYLSTFMQKHKDVKLSILDESDTRTIVRNLLQDKYDLAIVAQIFSVDNTQSNIDDFPLENYQIDTLIEDEYCVIVNSEHPLAKKRQLTWQDLKKEKLIIFKKPYSLNTIITDTLHSFGITPNVILEHDKLDTILGMLEANLGVSFLSSYVAKSPYDIKILKIKPPIRRNTVLITPKVKVKPEIKQFRQDILAYFTEK